MGMAFWMASKSKDPATQCGATIIGLKNDPLGWGYNGPPRSIRDEDIDWGRPAKYPYMRHAERNALDHSCGDLLGASLYVTSPPCDDCMNDIVDAGIKRVVYFPRYNVQDSTSMINNDSTWEIVLDMARKGNVKLEEFSSDLGDLNWMCDRLIWMRDRGIFELEKKV